MLVFPTFFFFQAEDGIRDGTVTGVQTCALPISSCYLLPDQAQHRLGAAPAVCDQQDEVVRSRSSEFSDFLQLASGEMLFERSRQPREPFGASAGGDNVELLQLPIGHVAPAWHRETANHAATRQGGAEHLGLCRLQGLADVCDLELVTHVWLVSPVAQK